MTVDYVIKLLESSSMVIVEQTRTGNNLGTVLKLANGAIVNCWDSGKVNCQGKNCKEVEALISGSVRTNVNRKVFVVYGHDLNARTQLEAMLRRWDLEPLIIDQLVSSGQTIIEKLEEYTDRFEKIHVILGFSLSTDGLYAVDSREKSKDADQAYFDKIFTFTSKMMYGYHPMISPENVHNACKNIDWWVEMYKKHNLDKSPNHRHPYPAMLEVRNDYWTDEQLKDYSTYLKHLWDICLKLNKDSFKNMARYLFVGDGKDGSLPSSGDYDPLKIMYMDEEDSRHLLGCTMQELIRINVADLSLCTCHRLTYPQFTGGKYILNENNEIVDLEPQAVTAWISLRAGSPAYYPKCENCEYNPVCMKGCLGSQYEYSGEIYYPIPKVCELEKTKINTMLELYYNGGIIATAIRENMIQRDSEMANYLIKLSEMRGYKIEL